MLGSAERGKVRLISRERIPTYMTTIPQRYRRTDRRTDGQLALAIPRSATLREVKTSSEST